MLTMYCQSSGRKGRSSTISPLMSARRMKLSFHLLRPVMTSLILPRCPKSASALSAPRRLQTNTRFGSTFCTSYVHAYLRERSMSRSPPMMSTSEIAADASRPSTLTVLEDGRSISTHIMKARRSGKVSSRTRRYHLGVFIRTVSMYTKPRTHTAQSVRRYSSVKAVASAMGARHSTGDHCPPLVGTSMPEIESTSRIMAFSSEELTMTRDLKKWWYCHVLYGSGTGRKK
mmetsp:Transcript_111925/g.316922  ORF Transcript_111925/g.316922 Transcript_111925/m.316922 type:complete len:230 (+) Transcript_111925:244-933(+)